MFFYFLRLLEKNLNVSAPFYTSLVRPKKWVRGQNIWSSCWVIKTLRSRGISSASKTNGFRESVKRKKSFLFGWTPRRCQKDFSRNQQKGGETHCWLTVHWSVEIGDFSWSHFDGNFDPIQMIKNSWISMKMSRQFYFQQMRNKISRLWLHLHCIRDVDMMAIAIDFLSTYKID